MYTIYTTRTTHCTQRATFAFGESKKERRTVLPYGATIRMPCVLLPSYTLTIERDVYHARSFAEKHGTRGNNHSTFFVIGTFFCVNIEGKIN